MNRHALCALPSLLAAWALYATPLARAAEPAAAPAEPAKAEPAKAEPAKAAAADHPSDRPAGNSNVETFDDQARFIAGLPVSEGSPLAEVEKDEQWQDYAKSLDKDWTKIRTKRLDAMSQFSSKELAPKIDPKANLFYFFGGPDFLSVSVLYPDAPVYILAGLEPIGFVPQISKMKQDRLDRSIDNLRKTIMNNVRASFFRTNDMSGDLTRTEFKGVLPVLELFAARADFKVLDVQYFELGDQGEEQVLADPTKGDKKKPQGIKLRLLKKGRDQEQVLYYLKQDVANSVLKNTPGFLAFFKKHAPANHFFKAASFILHDAKRFSTTRDFVMENALSILQDDSGVPFDQLRKPKEKEPKWTTHLYGKYFRPLPPFDKHYQDGLIKAFKTETVEPLPFVTGYRHEGEANLVLAIPKKAEEAKPAAAPAEPEKKEETKPTP
ncbi:MAG: hypothetical protein QM765_33010 [Myxococcales bacterium]